MKTQNGLAYLSLLIVILASVGHLVWQMPKLPDQVASHFDASGNPDSSMQRGVYFGFMLCLLVGMPVFLVVVSKSIRVLPASLINVPNRSYWLAPERRDATLVRIEGTMLWITIATQIFLVAISHLVFLANISGSQLASQTTFIAIGVYLGFTVVWCIWFTLQFRLPEKLV